MLRRSVSFSFSSKSTRCCKASTSSERDLGRIPLDGADFFETEEIATLVLARSSYKSSSDMIVNSRLVAVRHGRRFCDLGNASFPSVPCTGTKICTVGLVPGSRAQSTLLHRPKIHKIDSGETYRSQALGLSAFPRMMKTCQFFFLKN
jgi:hypothetical protein